MQNLDVGSLDFRGRGKIASVHPEHEAGMAAQPQDLRAQRGGGDFKIAGFPLVPFFPMTAAAPTRHHQHAHLVSEIEKLVASEFPFQPDGVQVHVANVAELRFQFLLGST